MASPERKLLWLDCDPGHDDAIAILIALYDPAIELLGISTVHGNAGLEHTTVNAAKLLHAFGAPQDIKVYPGADKPLIGPAHPAVDIHGNDGLGGVEGLPSPTDPSVLARIASRTSDDPSSSSSSAGLPAIRALHTACTRALREGRKLYLGVTGACTNAAIFLLMYPELARDAVGEIVCMGGGVGIGNITASAEFNLYIDPEAAQIVFESGIPVYLVPLNVTHRCLFHPDALAHLLDPSSSSSSSSSHASDPSSPGNGPRSAHADAKAKAERAAATPLRHTLSTLLLFFANTYREVFGFVHGPPIHDALVVAYLADRSLFTGRLCRVDVERGEGLSRGALVVDPFERTGSTSVRNVHVAQGLDVPAVLRSVFAAVHAADLQSPLNAGTTSIPRYVTPPDMATRAIPE